MNLAARARRAAPAALLALAALVSPSPVAAQVTPADSAAVLLEAAREFEATGRPEVAVALYELVARRWGGTQAGERAAEVLAGLRARGAPGSGRVELQVWSTLYGAFLGVAVPAAFGADGPEPYGIGLLVGGPAGFLFGRSVARERPLTEGQARAITFGGTWGAWQGLGWREVFDIGVEEVCEVFEGQRFCYQEEDAVEETFAAMIVGSLAGIAAGAALSGRQISPGVATTINFGALWGTWFGFAAGVLVDQEDDALLAATLLGGNAGLLGSALLAPRWNPSRNRARMVSIAGVIGGLAGAGLDLILQPDDERVAVAIPLATSVAGLAIGARATRDYDAARTGGGAGSPPDGSLIRLDDGGWSMDAPLPWPVWTTRDAPEGMRRRPGLGVTVLQARFSGGLP